MAFVASVPLEEESVGAVMRRYPDQAIPLMEMTEVVMRTGECAFTPEQRELIAAYASGTNSCTFCFDTHRATAEAFGVEDIIDPRETRPYLCQFVDAMGERLEQGLGPKMKSGVRP